MQGLTELRIARMKLQEMIEEQKRQAREEHGIDLEIPTLEEIEQLVRAKKYLGSGPWQQVAGRVDIEGFARKVKFFGILVFVSSALFNVVQMVGLGYSESERAEAGTQIEQLRESVAIKNEDVQAKEAELEETELELAAKKAELEEAETSLADSLAAVKRLETRVTELEAELEAERKAKSQSNSGNLVPFRFKTPLDVPKE